MLGICDHYDSKSQSRALILSFYKMRMTNGAFLANPMRVNYKVVNVLDSSRF